MNVQVVGYVKIGFQRASEYNTKGICLSGFVFMFRSNILRNGEWQNGKKRKL